MDLARADALAARSHLAARGWIARKADSFRHLPPPAASLWLGDAVDLAPWDAAQALADGWSLQILPDTAAGAVEARWLDAADAGERVDLFAGLGAPGDDDAAPFAWAHRALVRQGLRLRVAAGAHAVLHLRRRACRAVEAPLLRVELLPGARCVLLESHEGQDSAAVQNLQVHVQLAAGSSLQHLRHVAPGTGDRIAHHVHASVAADARYEQALVACGSDYHLQRNVLDLHGARAAARIGGVLLAAGSALEQQVLARHAATHTCSTAEVLALASGAARVVANAHTHIAAGSDDADARQRLAGIPTGGQPRIVLRPHLEIHHDQVQAAHGATWGALPPDALFHARQRGLDERAAKALIIEGLAQAVLARALGEALPEAVRLEAALAAAVARHLAGTPQGEPYHG
jgi:Fe-S cluster assembly protein SufD